MALLRDCIFRRGPNPLELLKLELNKFNLKALNKVTIRFDPFRDDVEHTRFQISCQVSGEQQIAGGFLTEKLFKSIVSRQGQEFHCGKNSCQAMHKITDVPTTNYSYETIRIIPLHCPHPYAFPSIETFSLRKGIVASLLHLESVNSKNQKCMIKTEILTDRSEQTITAEAINGETFIIKCSKLKSLDIFRLLNQYITPLAPVEEESLSAVPAKAKFIKKK